MCDGVEEGEKKHRGGSNGREETLSQLFKKPSNWVIRGMGALSAEQRVTINHYYKCDEG